MADILIIAFIILFILIGYKKGFVNTLLSMCSYLISTIATMLFFSPVHKYLLSTTFGTSICDKINKYLIEKFSDTILSEIPLPKIFTMGIDPNTTVSQNNVSNLIAQNITSTIFMILTFIILYFAIKIVLKLIRGPLTAISSLPIIKQVNRLGGGIIGAAMGILWLFVVVGIIAAFSYVDFISPIAKQIETSTIMGFLYNNNFLLGYIKL